MGVRGRGLYKAFAFTSVSPEEQRVQEEAQLHSVLSHIRRAFRLPAPAGNMAHHTSDPTKMGVGRSIAVLTSGGDAQGKSRTAGFQCSVRFTTVKRKMKARGEQLFLHGRLTLNSGQRLLWKRSAVHLTVASKVSCSLAGSADGSGGFRRKGQAAILQDDRDERPRASCRPR